MPDPKYGNAHQRTRAQWVPIVKRGGVQCRRASNGTCLEDDPTIPADAAFDLGHPDATCAAPTGPEHRRCNRATGTHRVRGTVRRQSRDWLVGGG